MFLSRQRKKEASEQKKKNGCPFSNPNPCSHRGGARKALTGSREEKTRKRASTVSTAGRIGVCRGDPWVYLGEGAFGKMRKKNISQTNVGGFENPPNDSCSVPLLGDGKKATDSDDRPLGACFTHRGKGEGTKGFRSLAGGLVGHQRKKT